ncbi:hypothetical protein [Streptomyces sp. NPDC056670]|uniref:hypothetical protein n=1 Tax=Streptomyces sp. NPDC056670 TaxID=3345904 RepID=UPI0036783792
MEQRSEHQYMPLGGAATDPSYVPGLVPARAVAQAPEPRSDGPVADDAVPEADEDGRVAVTAEAEAADGGAHEADAEAVDADADAEPDDGEGPACEISDRVGSLVAGRGGVRLRLLDEEADFRWDEISAVEYRTPWWSRRFEVVVYTPTHRRFSHDIEAPDRATLKQWTEQLEAVLDAYFED